MNDANEYGLWSLVIINSLVFVIFAFSFAKPQSPRDWRSFGAFSAFLVALFTEMYGFPLTIYLFSAGWLHASRVWTGRAMTRATCWKWCLAGAPIPTSGRSIC